MSWQEDIEHLFNKELEIGAASVRRRSDPIDGVWVTLDLSIPPGSSTFMVTAAQLAKGLCAYPHGWAPTNATTGDLDFDAGVSLVVAEPASLTYLTADVRDGVRAVVDEGGYLHEGNLHLPETLFERGVNRVFSPLGMGL